MKTININTELHTKIKIYCATHNIKLQSFIEDNLLKALQHYEKKLLNNTTVK